MISIIIPSYNQGQYLPDCLQSVIQQTKKPHEIIVVDDGSTDNSLAIAKSYPVRVISQVNKGLASARNTGIMNATGQYCLFLDADDLLAPNCVEKITKIIKQEVIKGSYPDVIAPSFKTFGTTNENVILMEHPTLSDFKTGNRLGYCSAIKRETLLEVGGYSPRMTWGYEDYHLWFNLLVKNKKIITLPEILWLYRTKESSMIHTAQAHHHELMEQINKDFNLW